MHLSKVMGCTPSSTGSFAWCPVTGELAWPVGNSVVTYNIPKNQQTRSFVGRPHHSITCLSFSQNGRYLLAGDHGPESAVFVWDLFTPSSSSSSSSSSSFHSSSLQHHKALEQNDNIVAVWPLDSVSSVKFGYNETVICALGRPRRSYNDSSDHQDTDYIVAFPWLMGQAVSPTQVRRVMRDIKFIRVRIEFKTYHISF